MLVLSRKKDEEIVLKTSDGDITIKVTRTGNKVALGFTAPPSVSIVRAELLKKQ